MLEVILTGALLVIQAILAYFLRRLHGTVKANSHSLDFESLRGEIQDLIVEEIRLQDDRIQKRIQRLSATSGTPAGTEATGLNIEGPLNNRPRAGQSIRRLRNG